MSMESYLREDKSKSQFIQDMFMSQLIWDKFKSSPKYCNIETKFKSHEIWDHLPSNLR